MSLERPPSAHRRASATARSPRFGDERGVVPRAVAGVRLRPDRAGGRRRPAGSSRASSRPTCRTSATGVLRGLHVHRRQLDHWIVTDGRAFVALVDVRPMLRRPGGRRRSSRRAILDADDWVDIPAGVAHGFLALEPLDLVYLVTNEYDGSDELGFAWDDPLAAVDWPAVLATAGRPADPVRARPDQPVAARTRGASAHHGLTDRGRTPGRRPDRRPVRTTPNAPAPHRTAPADPCPKGPRSGRAGPSRD